MRLRLLLLSLGFPARNPFERASQNAMRHYHLMLLRDEAPFVFVMLMFALVPLVFGISWKMAFLPVLFFVTPYACFLGITWSFSYWSKKPHTSHFYHVQFSSEVLTICRKINLPPVSVYSDMSQQEPIIGMIVQTGQCVILVPPDLERFLTWFERQGVYAHELGHFLLPLGLPPLAVSRRTLHAREFAADAIAAQILGNALPLASLFHRLNIHEARMGLRRESSTHPPLSDRINRLLDTHFAARNNTSA